MFKNPVTILITVGVLIAIAIALQFMKSQEKTGSEAIKAVPEDAAIVIETSNFYSLLKNYNNSNQFRIEFSDIEQLKDFFGQLEYMDSLFSANSNFQDLVQGKRMIVSGHTSANNSMEYLYVVPVNNEDKIDLINKEIANIVTNDATIRQRLYEGYTIYDVVFFREESKLIGFSYAFADGLFIFSISKILTESSVRRMAKSYSLANDKAFRKLMESAGKNVDANIYLNYKYLPNILKNSLAPGNGSLYEFVSTFSQWTELDLKYKDNAFLLSGFTFSNDSLNNYLNTFRSQSPSDNEFLEAIPGNTAAFIAFNLSNGKKWKQDYEKLLHKTSEFPRYESEMEKIEQKYRGKSNLFYENIDGCVAMVWLKTQADETQNKMLGIVQMRDADFMRLELENMRKMDSTEKSPVKIEQGGGYTAYPFSEPGMLRVLFGKAFQNLSANWYIDFNGYFVFAASVQELQSYLRNVKAGQKLKDDKNFEIFSKSIASESNLSLYVNVSGAKELVYPELNEKSQSIYNKNIEKINKIQAISIQFGSGSKLMSTNVFVSLNSRQKKTSKNTWEVALDGPLNMKPQIVKSHLTGNNEVIFQDEAGNLILVGETGTVLWKKPITGKILGEIHQVDHLKNGKLQYLFNTKEYLYLVDRNGKNVDDYPIKLKSPATNGMAVFDYDRDRTYRILLACENKNVYLLNTNGGKVDGWAFGQTESEVNLPAKHFIANGKDYIVFGDKSNTYILNRKGEARVLVKSKFERGNHSTYFFEKGDSEKDSRFITTGSNGDIYFIYLDGSVKKMSIESFSASHQFIYADIDGDGKSQFIFADKSRLYVYNRDKSLKFDKKFDGEIANRVNLYKIDSKSTFIGVSPAESDEIHLLNPSGDNIKGFPVQGSSPFSIAKIMVKSSDLNLIVAGADNYLLNYKLNAAGKEETKQN